jgi:hypothetical protein
MVISSYQSLAALHARVAVLRKGIATASKSFEVDRIMVISHFAVIRQATNSWRHLRTRHNLTFATMDASQAPARFAVAVGTHIEDTRSQQRTKTLYSHELHIHRRSWCWQKHASQCHCWPCCFSIGRELLRIRSDTVQANVRNESQRIVHGYAGSFRLFIGNQGSGSGGDR